MGAFRVVIHGRVQGVGYRWFAREVCEANAVSGWVRNRRNGTVEAELHGSYTDVQAVLDSMAQGPPGAQVDEIAVTDVSAPAARGFEIRATG